MGTEQYPHRTTAAERWDTERSPSTQELRAVAQRRRESEEKLEHHLQDAHKKAGKPHDDGGAADPERSTDAV